MNRDLVTELFALSPSYDYVNRTARTCAEERTAMIDHKLWLEGYMAAKDGKPYACRDLNWMRGWRDYHDAQRRAAARDGARL